MNESTKRRVIRDGNQELLTESSVSNAGIFSLARLPLTDFYAEEPVAAIQPEAGK
jgi:hypothetical protein